MNVHSLKSTKVKSFSFKTSIKMAFHKNLTKEKTSVIKYQEIEKFWFGLKL